MTQKELLYFEDAIGHEKNIISIIESSIDTIEDKELLKFLKNECKKHTSMQERLIKCLEVCKDE